MYSVLIDLMLKKSKNLFIIDPNINFPLFQEPFMPFRSGWHTLS